MLAIPTHWYALQFVYNHDVFDINESFHFLVIDEKVPPVFFADIGCFVEPVTQPKNQY